jgi:sigma54-dependent transcription regulator
VTGDTGTGKELAARALHALSPAASGQFVVCNCAAIPENLVESELFGHVKGAFTGAIHDKTGMFEHAHGGTLFLDEIGEMPPAAQAKLLRAVQNHEYQRVGSLAVRTVDVRIVAATNRDFSLGSAPTARPKWLKLLSEQRRAWHSKRRPGAASYGRYTFGAFVPAFQPDFDRSGLKFGGEAL